MHSQHIPRVLSARRHGAPKYLGKPQRCLRHHVPWRNPSATLHRRMQCGVAPTGTMFQNTLHEITCRSLCTCCARRDLHGVAEQHGTCMRRRTAGGDKETRFCTPSALRPPASASILRRPHGPRLGVCASHDAFHALAPLALCWGFFGRCCGRLAAGLCRGRGSRKRAEYKGPWWSK